MFGRAICLNFENMRLIQKHEIKVKSIKMSKIPSENTIIKTIPTALIMTLTIMKIMKIMMIKICFCIKI